MPMAAAPQTTPIISRAVGRVVELGEERRVGAGDEQEDRGMVEAPQHPFRPRDRPQIVGAGDRQHGQQRDDVEDRRDIFPRAGMEGGKGEQDRSGRDRQHDADRVDDAVGDQLGARIVEAPGRTGYRLSRLLHRHSNWLACIPVRTCGHDLPGSDAGFSARDHRASRPAISSRRRCRASACGSACAWSSAARGGSPRCRRRSCRLS